MDIIERNLIVIGAGKTGKTTFIDSIGLLQLVPEGQTISLASELPCSQTLYGEDFTQTHHFKLQLNSTIVMSLTIKEYPSINDEKEIEDASDKLFDKMDEDMTDYHGILFFYSGKDCRFDIRNKVFLERLIIRYGPNVLRNLVLIQSFSNQIVYPKAFHVKDCEDRVNKFKRDFDSFYQNRYQERCNNYIKIFEDIIGDISTRFSNIEDYKIPSAENLISNITIISVGIIFKEKSDEVINVGEVSSVPCYPKPFEECYNRVYKKSCNDIKWIARFTHHITLLVSTINFSEREKEVKKIIKQEIDDLESKKIDYEALEKAKKIVDEKQAKLKTRTFLEKISNLHITIGKGLTKLTKAYIRAKYANNGWFAIQDSLAKNDNLDRNDISSLLAEFKSSLDDEELNDMEILSREFIRQKQTLRLEKTFEKIGKI